jgi:hypothetical protein
MGTSMRKNGKSRGFPNNVWTCDRSLRYPGHFVVKRVTNAGTFRLKHKLLFIANALKQHHIGLEETDDGIWSINFGTVLLAKVDERDMIIRD